MNGCSVAVLACWMWQLSLQHSPTIPTILKGCVCLTMAANAGERTCPLVGIQQAQHTLASSATCTRCTQLPVLPRLLLIYLQVTSEFHMSSSVAAAVLKAVQTKPYCHYTHNLPEIRPSFAQATLICVHPLCSVY